MSTLTSPQSPPGTPKVTTSSSESRLDVMQEEIFNLILGTENTRQGTAVAPHSIMATPIKNRASFEGMLAEEANYIPGCQPRHVRFMDTMKDQIASTLHNLQEEVVLPSRPISESHQKEIGLYTAAREFRKMQEPKISKLRGGYTSSRTCFPVLVEGYPCPHARQKAHPKRGNTIGEGIHPRMCPG